MCRRRADLVIENLALRQQATALKKERPHPTLEDVDRAFWVALRESWRAWGSRLVIVKAGTVAEWNRVRFRRYWTRISSTRYPGRPCLAANLAIHSRSSQITPPRDLCPVSSESIPIPPRDRVRVDDDQATSPPGPRLAERHPECAVGVVEERPGSLLLEHSNLLP